MNDPILIIGLGGTGALTVRAVKSFLRLRGECKNIEYLAIDLENSQIFQKDDTGRFAALESEKREFCVVSPKTIAERHASIDKANKDTAQFQHILDWYPDPEQKFGYTQSKKGAAQYRFLGRLGFILNEYEIMGAITEKLNEVRNTKHRKGVLDDSVNLTVCIIGSLAGGTGSGMFWDVAYRVRDLHKEALIYGFFLLPDVFMASDFGGRIMQNTYAALKEISNLKNQREAFNITYESGHRLKFPRGGFNALDRVYLFNNEVGGAWITKEIEETCYSMGVNIASFFEPDLRRKITSSEANMKGDGAFSREDRQSTFVFNNISSAILGWFGREEVINRAANFLTEELRKQLRSPQAKEKFDETLIEKLGQVLSQKGPSGEIILGNWIRQKAMDEERRSGSERYESFRRKTLRKCASWNMELFQDFLKSLYALTGFHVDATSIPYSINYEPGTERKRLSRNEEVSKLPNDLKKEFLPEITLQDVKGDFPLHLYHRGEFLSGLVDYLERKSGINVPLKYDLVDLEKTLNLIRVYLAKEGSLDWFLVKPGYLKFLVARVFEILNEVIFQEDIIQKRRIAAMEMEVSARILKELKELHEEVRREEAKVNDFFEDILQETSSEKFDGAKPLRYLSEKSVNYLDLGNHIVMRNRSRIQKYLEKNLAQLAGQAYFFAKEGDGKEFRECFFRAIQKDIKIDEKKELKAIFEEHDGEEILKLLGTCQTNIFDHRGRLVNNISERLTALGYTPKVLQESLTEPEFVEKLKKQLETILKSKVETVTCDGDYIIVLHQELFNSAEQLTRIYDYYEEYKKSNKPALFHVDRNWVDWEEIVVYERISRCVCGNEGCDYDIGELSRDSLKCPGCSMFILNRCGNKDCQEDRLMDKNPDIEKRYCPTCKKYLKTYWWRCNRHGDIPIDKEYCPHCIYLKRKGILKGEVSRRSERTTSIVCPNCHQEGKSSPFFIGPDLYRYYQYGVNGHEARNFEKKFEGVLVNRVRCPECYTTLIPTCPDSSDYESPHFIFRRRLHSGNYDNVFMCSTHKDHEFYNCFHCGYPNAFHEDGVTCPRCGRTLEKCGFCSDKKRVLIEKEMDLVERNARWCPSCHLHPYPVSKGQGPELTDDMQWCANIFGCSAGKELLNNAFGIKVERCTICNHGEILPLTRRAKEFHLNKCLFCREIFYEGRVLKLTEPERDGGRCYLCGMDGKNLAEIKEKEHGMQQLERGKGGKISFEEILTIGRALVKEKDSKEIAERLYVEFDKFGKDIKYLSKRVDEFIQMIKKKPQENIARAKLTSALEIITGEILGDRPPTNARKSDATPSSNDREEKRNLELWGGSNRERKDDEA
jgi:rubrerythrin